MIKRAMINRRHNLHLLTVEGSQRHHRVLVVVVDRAWLPVPGVVTRHVTRGAQHGHTLHAADGAGARHEEGAHVSQLGRGHHGVTHHHRVAGAGHPETENN